MRSCPSRWLLALGILLGANAPIRAETSAPLFDDLGSYHRPVTTASKEAQRYFDQGLVLYFGFNHEEAARSFAAAAELDPESPMAPWGIALSVGPNINNPSMDEAASRTAHEALEKALSLVEKASPVERGLIEALASRYAWPPPEDRAPLDSAYAEAMRELWRAHPEDPDVGVLYAEALMDLRPWDLWTSDGRKQPGTGEVIETLETLIDIAPHHPFPHHLYIHTMEASPYPEKALASADRLRDLVPGAGHLVHMPGHIYMRLGRYDEVVKANQRAIEADLRYVDRVGRQGFYTFYRAHNYHFLAYAAMFEGRKEEAMRAARNMVAEIPLELARRYPDFLDGFIPVPIHVMVRFGLWNQILDEPRPPEDLLATTAFWRYGRTVALSVLGRVEEAAREMEAFRAACEDVPESRLIGNNTARVVLQIGLPMAEGELEYRRGNYDRAFELLREAVRRDDQLRYDEPWGWMQPARHSLGALLLEQDRLEEAEAVYREDLRIHPANGWALHGLAECLRRTGREKEAAEATALYEISWARSDIRIPGSCYCRTRE
jgi:tetratricopeptide (TPR) repeat protein